MTNNVITIIIIIIIIIIIKTGTIVLLIARNTRIFRIYVYLWETECRTFYLFDKIVFAFARCYFHSSEKKVQYWLRHDELSALIYLFVKTQCCRNSVCCCLEFTGNYLLCRDIFISIFVGHSILFFSCIKFFCIF
jgi:hypothetical protein